MLLIDGLASSPGFHSLMIEMATSPFMPWTSTEGIGLGVGAMELPLGCALLRADCPFRPPALRGLGGRGEQLSSRDKQLTIRTYMTRTTRKDLERLVARVTRLQQRPEAAYVKGEDGKYHCQVGALQLDHNSCYGGWDLVEMVNGSGGQQSLIGNTFAGRGRLSAHEMESFLLGMLSALNYHPIVQQEVA